MREKKPPRRYGAKKISTLHNCWFPALRRTAACKFANGSKTRIAQVNPCFYLFGALCKFGGDLISGPGHVIVSADHPQALAGGDAIADFRGECVSVDAGAS